jgi:hypothetical protein
MKALRNRAEPTVLRQRMPSRGPAELTSVGRGLFEAELSHSVMAVSNRGEGSQRLFSYRPRQRLIQHQGRTPAAGWNQAKGDGPVCTWTK